MHLQAEEAILMRLEEDLDTVAPRQENLASNSVPDPNTPQTTGDVSRDGEQSDHDR